VDRSFTLEEAVALLPIVRRGVAMLVAARTCLVEQIGAHPVSAGSDGYRSAAAFRSNETMRSVLGSFERRGIQIKGIAPVLVDFPSHHGGRQILLCWREGEDTIEWYHLPEAGFAGRRPISDLDGLP